MPGTFGIKTQFTSGSGTSFSRQRTVQLVDTQLLGNPLKQILHFTIPVTTTPSQIFSGGDTSFGVLSGYDFYWIVNRSTSQNLKIDLVGSTKTGHVSLAPGMWYMGLGINTSSTTIDGVDIDYITASFPSSTDEVEIFAFSLTPES